MTNETIIQEICNVMAPDTVTNKEIMALYRMDSRRFDLLPNEVEELFLTFIGPNKGRIAFKIYKSRTNT